LSECYGSEESAEKYRVIGRVCRRTKNHIRRGTLMREWQIITVCASLVAVCNIIVMAYVKHIVTRSLSQIETKYLENNKKIEAVEKQLYEIKADLPICYVRREDFVRNEVMINAKLDRIYDRIEKQKEKGV